MMIAASEPQEFVPFGRQQMQHHPKSVHINDGKHQLDSTLLNRLSQVVISDSCKSKESWILRSTFKDDAECEEELYVNDKTVVWSIGPASVDCRTNRILKCCYTSETVVQEALWCNFHLSMPDFPSTFFSTPISGIAKNVSPDSQQDGKHMKNCICILNASVIKTFTPTGQEYITSSQFQVQKMWAIKYGLLLERRVNKETVANPIMIKKKPPTDLRRQSIEQSFLQKGSNGSMPFWSFQGNDPILPTESPSDLPTLFSLSHPLDEISPITSKTETSNYVSNPDLKIIFTCESPSLCLCLDRKTGLHAVYLIRKATQHESEMCGRRETRPSRRNSYTNASKLSGSNNSFVLEPPFLSLRTRKSLGLTFPNMQSSPFNSFDVRTSSPISSRTSPLLGFSHYTPNSRKGDSCQSSFSGTPSRIEHRMLSEDVEHSEARPLFPQICLQCVWVDSPDPKGVEFVSEASKAFLSTDILGQRYLCYLVQLKLYLLKIDVRSDEEFSLANDVCFLHAKDAAALESRNMIAVISLDGGVEVYSGNVHVAKILISGVSSSIATSSYLSDFNAGPTFFSKPSPGAFPKRSSLLPQCVPLESPVFNESLSQFSPVTTCSSLSPTLPTEREGALIALKDNVAGRISLEYSSSLLFRLELPNFGNSPLVESILNAFKIILPQKICLQFLIKWYANRNAPGSYNVCLKEEFEMFIQLLYASLGYDLESLMGDQMDQSSPVTRPKKQRTSELQSDEDWNFLIGSQHHKMSSKHLQHLNVAAFQLRAKDLPQNSEITETPLVAASRSFHKITKSTSTPSKRMLKGETSQSIDETPIVPKTSFGKNRSSRFQKSLGGVEETPLIPKKPLMVFNKKAPLYPYFQSILYTLHLLYEDLKLNVLRTLEQDQLVPVLYQMAKDVGCNAYIHHYWADNPENCRLIHLKPVQKIEQFLLEPVPSIFEQLNNILLKKPGIRQYPYLTNVNFRSKIIVQAFGLMSYRMETEETILRKMTKFVRGDEKEIDTCTQSLDADHRVALYLSNNGITKDTLQTLPAGVTLTLRETLYRCRENPASGWTPETYELIDRPELASILRAPCDRRSELKGNDQSKLNTEQKTTCELDDDGMEELRNLDVLKLRWGNDQRIIELRRMLQSAFPVQINIQQRPEVSDHEFQQEQERFLYAMSARTMALPIGRGMVTIGCGSPVITEKLTIPQLCLAGKIPPADKLVDMSHIEVPANMNEWPLFHNGVAAGLRIPPNAPDIDSQWIIYNKPKSHLEDQIEHAGFLMALGLNGHLKDLMDLTIFMYLVKSHEMTRVGLMLGLAVSKRGTMDIHTVKVVSVHIEAMLPPTGIELDLDVIVEPAALISLGFLYQGTAHRHISQVLLQEIGRPPGPEMENSVDRESYSLAAGLALGLVVFGRGNSLSGLADMTIPDTLHHFMVGGPKRPYLGSQRDKYKNASFLISEGPLVNTHVTGPGATLALGMLYFNTSNRAVAEWLKVPETQHLLEAVLPDALLLRTLAKALILWSEIEPTKDWVISNIPAFVLPHCLVKPSPEDDSCIDYETMNQAYCNIVAGACMAIGLKYAGSAHEDAKAVILEYSLKFTQLLGKNLAEICGKATMETCLNVITVSLAMVMAGTGCLDVIRLCRHLRSRVGPNNSSVTYGSHLATHMAMGLLFLGGGSLTLSSSPDAIAALLCAFYPKWPVCSSDNRYHLQALRHLYVLAVEPRLLLPRDIGTKSFCYAHVTCLFIDGSIYKEKEKELLAPCLLPELNQLKEVRIEDKRYWTLIFKRNNNWQDLKKILAWRSFVDVKRRDGFHTFCENPEGYESLITLTPGINGVIPWSTQLLKPREIIRFSANPNFEKFVFFLFGVQQMDHFPKTERKALLLVSSFTYFCLTSDKILLLSTWLTLLKLAQSLSTNPTVNAIWQWKLVFSQSQRSDYQLMPPEIPLSMKQDLKGLLESWEPGVLVDVKNYLRKDFESHGLDEGRVVVYLAFHDIPYPGEADYESVLSGNMISTLEALKDKLSSTALLSILPLLEV